MLDERSERKTLCILVPLCNERDSLPQLEQELKQFQEEAKERYQIRYLFVDDGSTDGTGEQVALMLSEQLECEVLRHPHNLGLGAALRTGFRAAQADIVCTTDADCTYSMAGLLPMIRAIENGSADVVVASPYHPEGAVEGVPWWRLFLSRQCSRLYRHVLPVRLHTYTSLQRAYRGSSVEHLLFASDGFICCVDTLRSAHAHGDRIIEIPATLHSRKAGFSKMKVARTIGEHLRVMAGAMVKPDSRPSAPPVTPMMRSGIEGRASKILEVSSTPEGASAYVTHRK